MAVTQAGIRWVRPPAVIRKGLDGYEKRLLAAARMLLEFYAPQVETRAKATAPWTDRTGNARQTLFTVVEADKRRAVLYLSHGMEYGVYLELCWQGKYAIILRTLESYHGPIRRDLRQLVRG